MFRLELAYIKLWSHPPRDFPSIRTLSTFTDIDKLLYYMNWNQMAFSIIKEIFATNELVTVDDEREYSWDDVDALADNTDRSLILAMENNTATLIYFDKQPTTRRNLRNNPNRANGLLEKPVEHNLTSTKQFHRINTTKLSTFHLDSAKTLTHTDQQYLDTIHSAINTVRQEYTLINVRSRKVSTIESLQKLLEDTSQIRSHIDRKLLSRQRYIKLRRYTGTIQTRIQRLIAKITERNDTSRQTTMTQYLQTANYTSAKEYDSPVLDSDQAEDYRGESD